MAKTTFTGPLRSRSTNGFVSVTVNSTTGAETTYGKLIGTHLQIDVDIELSGLKEHLSTSSQHMVQI